MSSYGSMSPSDEGFDRYEPPYYCQPSHQGSPMDGGVYWPAANGEGHEFDGQDVYDTTHYIGRGYGYEEMQMVGNEPYDTYHHNIQHSFPPNTTGLDCDLQSLPLRYDRPAPPSFVRVAKRRTTANKKERRRTQSINTAFSDLRDCIPNVPPDTKLSKIKTLRLATSYISYLLKVLETDGEPAGGFRADLHHTPPRRRTGEGNQQASSAEKRGKGRTGWPQHVWALELKSEQNLQT
uniref:BHLH domain-containing protein n=1 Tax=Heliothis virescens TaxID=7102 RepID=A0A2A4J6Y9_HELVI